MKKLILLAVLTCTFSFHGHSQYTTADVFKVDEITFYGLDFSNIKLIGSDGFTDPWDIKNRLFNSWNSLFRNEPDKYNLKEFFYKSSVKLNLDVVKERNQIPDPEELVTDQTYSFGKDIVEKVISDYEIPEEEGIGLVFVMESFDKNQKKGFMWVTFFDLASKKVLFTEKMSGKAQGFGIRNYYANTYYTVMKEIGKNSWKKWADKY